MDDISKFKTYLANKFGNYNKSMFDEKINGEKIVNIIKR